MQAKLQVVALLDRGLQHQPWQGMEIGVQHGHFMAGVDLAHHVQSLIQGKGTEVVAVVRFIVFLQLDLVHHLDLGAGGNVLGDDAGRADKHVIANQHIAQHAGPGPDLDVIAQAWMALAIGVVGDATGAQGHATEDVAVVADFAGFADHRAVAVVQHEASADACSGVNLCTGKHLALVAQLEGNAREHAVGLVGEMPYQVRQAVIQHRLERSVGFQDQLAAPAGGRVTVGVGDQVLGHRLRRILDQRGQVRFQLFQLGGREGLDEVGEQLIVQLLHVDKTAHGGTPVFWLAGNPFIRNWAGSCRHCRRPWSAPPFRAVVRGRAWRWPPCWRRKTGPG